MESQHLHTPTISNATADTNNTHDLKRPTICDLDTTTEGVNIGGEGVWVMCSRDFGEEGGPRRDRPVSLFFLGCFCFKLCLFLSDVLLWGLGWLGQHHCITSTALGLLVFGRFFLSGFTRGGSKRARDEGGRGRGGFNTFLSILSLPSVCRMPVSSIPWICSCVFKTNHPVSLTWLDRLLGDLMA